MNYSSDFNNFFRFQLLAVCTTLLQFYEGQNFGAPIFIALFLKYKQRFHEIIINNDANHKNYDTTMCHLYSTYFNSIGQKIHTLPRCALVTIQVTMHILHSIRFWCGFDWQGVFFVTSMHSFAKRQILHRLYCTQTLSYNIS